MIVGCRACVVAAGLHDLGAHLLRKHQHCRAAAKSCARELVLGPAGGGLISSASASFLARPDPHGGPNPHLGSKSVQLFGSLRELVLASRSWQEWPRSPIITQSLCKAMRAPAGTVASRERTVQGRLRTCSCQAQAGKNMCALLAASNAPLALKFPVATPLPPSPPPPLVAASWERQRVTNRGARHGQ